jgi:hypothetical protein
MSHHQFITHNDTNISQDMAMELLQKPPLLSFSFSFFFVLLFVFYPLPRSSYKIPFFLIFSSEVARVKQNPSWYLDFFFFLNKTNGENPVQRGQVHEEMGINVGEDSRLINQNHTRYQISVLPLGKLITPSYFILCHHPHQQHFIFITNSVKVFKDLSLLFRGLE